jgi:hypothetical protein
MMQRDGPDFTLGEGGTYPLQTANRDSGGEREALRDARCSPPSGLARFTEWHEAFRWLLTQKDRQTRAKQRG